MTDSENRAWDKVSELEDKITRRESQIEQLTYLHNEDVSTIKLLNEQIEKMKCCGNCGNEGCTSKYRGNFAYHRQSDGFACADNEDWKPREIKENE